MNKTYVGLALLLSFLLAAQSFGQIFINFRNAGTFFAPDYSELGLTAVADSGVHLLQVNGIAVAGGDYHSLIEEGETLEVNLPFPAVNVRLDSFPTRSNFVFDYEAFDNGGSLGNLEWNFIFQNELDLAAQFGQPLDRFTMTGIGGPTLGDNVGYVVFSPPPLVNDGFEDGKPGNGVPGWQLVNDANTSDNYAYTGSNSVQLIVPVGNDFESSQVQQTFDGLVEGMFVQGAAFALNPSDDPITGENYGRVVLDFFDADGNVIDVNSSPAETGVLSESITATTPMDEFVFLNTGYFEAPAGTQSARISLQHTQSPNPNNQGSGAVFFDDGTMKLSTFPIKRTLLALGEEFSVTDTQQLMSDPPILYEIIHDGVTRIRFDTFDTNVVSRLMVYDDSGRLIYADSGSPSTLQAQIFFESLPAGRYVAMVGGMGVSSFAFYFDAGGLQPPSSGNFVFTVSSNYPIPEGIVGAFMPVGFDFFDQDIQNPADDGRIIFYEVFYDGVAPISFSAEESVGANLGFYDIAGNLLSQGPDMLDFDSLEAGTYYLAVGNAFVEYFPNFEFSTFAVPFGPVVVDVSTAKLGDINCDGVISLLDVAPFIDIVLSGDYLSKADINQDGNVDLLDVEPFVDLLTGG